MNEMSTNHKTALIIIHASTKVTIKLFSEGFGNNVDYLT